jgi:hypothetical protein
VQSDEGPFEFSFAQDEFATPDSDPDSDDEDYGAAAGPFDDTADARGDSGPGWLFGAGAHEHTHRGGALLEELHMEPAYAEDAMADYMEWALEDAGEREGAAYMPYADDGALADDAEEGPGGGGSGGGGGVGKWLGAHDVDVDEAEALSMGGLGGEAGDAEDDALWLAEAAAMAERGCVRCGDSCPAICRCQLCVAHAFLHRCLCLQGL